MQQTAAFSPTNQTGDSGCNAFSFKLKNTDIVYSYAFASMCKFI